MHVQRLILLLRRPQAFNLQLCTGSMLQLFPCHLPLKAPAPHGLPLPLSTDGAHLAKCGTQAGRAGLLLACVVAMRSHSRPEQVPDARRQRMLRRPSHKLPTGRDGRNLQFLNQPAGLNRRRSNQASGARGRIKHCKSPNHLLNLVEQAATDNVMEASVIGAAMQKCGQSFWWDTLVALRAIQLQKGVRLSTVELSIVMTSLAFCLRRKGKMQVLPQRVPAVLAMAQDTWTEVDPPRGASGPNDFNCCLSSALKLARQMDCPSAKEWGMELWSCQGLSFLRDPLSHSTYVAFLEHYRHHDEVDAVLAKENVDAGKVELNCVTLGALLDVAASQTDLQRVEHFWNMFIRAGLKPNLICYNGYAKAYLLAGCPTRVVTALSEVLDDALEQCNCQTVTALAQSLLILCHSSLAAPHLQRLQGLLSTHSALIGRKASRHMARDWKRFQDVAANLSTQPTLSLHDVLIEWKAKNLSSMAGWPNFAAGENYLPHMEAMPSAARKEMGDKLSCASEL
ncbi:unnamed protein product [Effrenium voratum]|uniref:Uncharacterized protein n=1 Tax=Effrenium voratum TaxID=2562239 RepID=A0AA36HN83_9DINO|nr:unnamed protein product [Effrenium voratum]